MAVVPLPPEGPGVGSYKLFETAQVVANDPTNYGGTGANSDFFPGVSFRVERPTKISQVGAWMGGSGTIFAAIVDLGGSIYNEPNPYDLSGSNVLATSLIDIDSYDYQYAGGDVTADFDLTLQPGAYAVIFGAGKFGADADGDGLLRDAHIRNGIWSTYTLRQADGAFFYQGGRHRVFAIADSADGTFQVRPTFDVQVEATRSSVHDEIINVHLIDGDDVVSAVLPTSNANPDKLPLMEFSIEEIPTDREVRAATLEIDVRSATASSQYSVFGYAGDGTPGRSDAYAVRELIGEVTLSGSGQLSIPLNPTFITDLVSAGVSHLGLIFEPKGTGSFSFATLESGESEEPALLTIALGPEVLAGDYNGDGVINAADYTVWRDSLGQTGSALAADGDGNGSVGAEDLNLWRSNYGATINATEANVAVPEAGTATMLAIALGLGFCGRDSR